MLKKPKKKTKSQLVKELDKWYSLYTRLSWSNDHGMCQCVTCNVIKHYKEMQDGHFISRGNYKYRWSDDNNFVQCYVCNVILNGNYQKYTMFMIKRYGIRRVKKRINEVKQINDIKPYEIEEKIECYKELVKDMQTTI